MTVPSERYNALNRTREFMRELLDPKKTPRVPSKVRKEAYWCLRHYPSKYDVSRLAVLWGADEIIEAPPLEEEE